MGDTVLEKVVRDLHDTGGVLNNGDIGALFKLADGVNQAIFRNSSVRIDDKDDSAAVSETRSDEQMYLHVNISRRLTFGCFHPPKPDPRFQQHLD